MHIILFIPTDNITALRQQNTVLKEFCKALKDERDTAVIDYAVVEGMCVYTIFVNESIVIRDHVIIASS